MSEESLKRFFWTALVVVALGGQPSFAQKNPNEAIGLEPGNVYQFLDTDSVSVYNGNLLINLPIGGTYPVGPTLSYGLTLSYNSAGIWDYEDWERCDDESDPDCDRGPEAFPSFRSNASPGWRVSLGRLFPPDEPSMPPPYKPNGNYSWVYEGPTGDEHAFDISSAASGPLGQHVARTGGTDSLALRLRWNDADPNVRLVELPSGEVHRFELTGPTFDSRKWRLRMMYDRFGSWVKVDYEYDSNERETKWTISDSLNRQQVVEWSHAPQLAHGVSDGQIVASVTLQAAQGAQATYLFGYTPLSTPPGCRHTGSYYPGAVSYVFPMLTSVTLPDQTKYSFEYVQSRENCEQGALERITYPTRGSVEYTYQPYGFAADNICSETYWTNISALYGFAGIKTRKVSDGVATRTWEYVQRRGPSLAERVGWSDPEPCGQQFYVQGPFYWSRTSVLAPVDERGKRTRTDHYFNIYNPELLTQNNGSQTQGHTPPDPWSPTGFKPLTTTANTAGVPPEAFAKASPYIVPESYDDTVDWPDDIDARDSTRFSLASEGARNLASFAFEDCDASGDCTNGELTQSSYTRYEDTTFGSRLKSSRTVFEDDDGCAGKCWTTSANDAYDGAGHFGSATFASNFPDTPTRTTNTAFRVWTTDDLLNPDEIWITGLYTDVSTVEGTSTRRQQFDFDPSTGFLRRTRILAGAQPGFTDILKIFEHNTRGEVHFESTYGGDQPEHALPLDGDLANLDLTTTSPISKTENSFANGVLEWSRGYDYTAQQYLDFKSVDRTIDIAGFVVSSRTPAGFETNIEYDTMGRLVTVRPALGAFVKYEYFPATTGYGTGRASARMSRWPEGANGSGEPSSDQEQIEYIFDGLGRLVEEARRMPEGTSRRLTLFDSMGRRWKVSEPEFSDPPNHFTIYTYDGSGRPTKIVAPDGSETKMTYVGSRETIREVQVDGEAAQTVETYDGLGRLRAVTENSGLEDAAVTTSYSYDLTDKLTEAKTAAEGTVQLRSFRYDGRGFLWSESHPERGTTMYTYDARGNVTHSSIQGDSQGTFSLDYAYDAAGRLREVAHQGSPIETYEYDEIDGPVYRKMGKLLEATTYNQTPAGPSIVTERYEYDKGAEQLSKKRTIIDGTEFILELEYDALGQLEELDYPRIATRLEEYARPQPYIHENGLLKGITGYGTLTYHANGLLNQVLHENGVSDTTSIDPATGMARPWAIEFRNYGDPVDVDCPLVPISQEPQDQLVANGGNATLSIEIDGDPSAYTFEWWKGLGPDSIKVGEGPSYTATSVTEDTTYWVRFRANSPQECTPWHYSRHAFVRVCKVSITSVPTQVSGAASEVLTLAVTATGPETLSYEWSYADSEAASYVTIPNETSSELLLDPGAGELYNKPFYKVKVTSSCGASATSNAIRIERCMQLGVFNPDPIAVSELRDWSLVIPTEPHWDKPWTVEVYKGRRGDASTLLGGVYGIYYPNPTITMPPFAESATIWVRAFDASDNPVICHTDLPEIPVTVVPVLSGLTLSPATVVGGSTVTGTVTLNRPLVAGESIRMVIGQADTGIALFRTSEGLETPVISLLPTEMPPAATFTIATKQAVTQPRPVGITAVYVYSIDGNQHASSYQLKTTLTVRPPGIASFVLRPEGSTTASTNVTLIGGMTATGTITLDAPAWAGGAQIELLRFGGDNAIVVPATVHVHEGETSVTFPIQTFEVASPTLVTLKGKYGGSTSGLVHLIVNPYLSLAMDPASVTAGRLSHATLTRGSEAPLDEVITISSSRPEVAMSTPATITIPAGIASAQFVINSFGVSQPESTTITANGPGGSVSGKLVVNPVTSFDVILESWTIPSGGTTTGTIELEGPAGPGGATFTLASNDVTFGANPVVIAQGATSTTFTIQTTQQFVSSEASFSVSRGSETREVTVRLVSLDLTNLEIDPIIVTAGSTATGAVYLSAPAASNVTVNLQSEDATVATVPAQVVVPMGSSTVSFTIGSVAGTPKASARIYAFLSSNQVSNVLMLRPSVVGISLLPSMTIGGGGATGTVTLSNENGGTATLSSSPSGLVEFWPSVTVPEGQSAASFTLTSNPVTEDTVVTIAAQTGDVIKTANLTLVPAVLQYFEQQAAPVIGGNPATGTVWLTQPAPVPTIVSMRYTTNGSFWTPFAVTVPAGERSAPYSIPTTRVFELSTWRIDATCGGATYAQNLALFPYEIASLTLDRTTAYDSQRVNLTVTLNGPALAGGVLVDLASTNPAAASLPAAATVPGGQASVVLPIDLPWGANGETNLTATLGDVTATIALTVQQIQVQSLAITPSVLYGGESATATITVTGPPGSPMTIPVGATGAGSHEVSIPTVTIPQDATTTTFTIGSTEQATGSVQVRASSTIAQTLTFNPTVAGLTTSAATMLPSSAATGTLTLNASGGGTVTLTSSPPDLLIVPATITLASSETSKEFAISAAATIAEPTIVTVTATTGPQNRQIAITVTPTQLNTLSFSPVSIEGGTSTTGTVTLTHNAPAGGALITLSSTPSLLTTPTTVTVLAGAATANFTAEFAAVPSPQTVTTAATYDGVTRTSAVTLTPLAPPALLSLTPDTTSAFESQHVNLTVTLSKPAPSGGVAVALASSDSTIVPVQASVTVAQGQSSLVVPIDLPWGAPGSATISANLAGVTKTATVSVALIRINSLAVSPAALYGGESLSVQIGVTGAPGAAMPIVVWATGGAGSALTIPPVSVAAEQTSTTFTITTAPGALGSAVVNARRLGQETWGRNVSFYPALSNLTASATTTWPTQPVIGTVTLNTTGGNTVTLTSSDPSLLSVPATVTVAANKTTATFTIQPAASIPATTPVTITASTGPFTRTVTITANPTKISSLYTNP
ncbi:MAG: hypothetical protein ACSLE8_07450, partial [Rhodococcus sp. (in: high G+C Gram-positive bacteria)]